MIDLIAYIAVILFVAQAQVDVLASPASNVKIVKLLLLALAVIAIFYGVRR